MKYLLFIIICSMAIAQSINYYDTDGESFADVKVNDLTFTCRVSGLENTGDAVILLHGFPETSRMYYDLIPVLVSEGYKVVAPDQRGYSQGARPPKISDYSIDKLSQDVIDIADAFQFEKFHLVGHDWGSAVGWVTVAFHSDRVISWTALSVPHLDAFFDAINTDKDQQRKSQYIKKIKKPKKSPISDNLIWAHCSNKKCRDYTEMYQIKALELMLETCNLCKKNFKKAIKPMEAV